MMMKLASKSNVWRLGLFVFCGARMAMGQQEPNELVRLRAVYQAQIEKAQSQYTQELDKLLKNQMQNGSLDGALATKKEKEKIGGPVSAAAAAAIPIEQSPFCGTKWTTRGAVVLEFGKDGKWKHGSDLQGQWHTTSDPRLILLDNWPEHPEMMFVLTRPGAECLRAVKPEVYQAMDGNPGARKDSSSKPDKASSTNPFGNTR